MGEIPAIGLPLDESLEDPLRLCARDRNDGLRPVRERCATASVTEVDDELPLADLAEIDLVELLRTTFDGDERRRLDELHERAAEGTRRSVTKPRARVVRRVSTKATFLSILGGAMANPKMKIAKYDAAKDGEDGLKSFPTEVLTQKDAEDLNLYGVFDYRKTIAIPDAIAKMTGLRKIQIGMSKFT